MNSQNGQGDVSSKTAAEYQLISVDAWCDGGRTPLTAVSSEVSSFVHNTAPPIRPRLLCAYSCQWRSAIFARCVTIILLTFSHCVCETCPFCILRDITPREHLGLQTILYACFLSATRLERSGMQHLFQVVSRRNSRQRPFDKEAWLLA